MSTSQFYDQQIDSIDRDLARHRSVDHRYGTARVISFAAIAICLLTAMTGGGGVFWTAAMISFVVFIGLVIANEPVRVRLAQLSDARQTLGRLHARATGDWETLQRIGDAADPVAGLSPQARAVAGDLDLFGKVSLFRLISMCGTAPGVRTLSHWIADPIDANLSQQRSELSSAMVDDRDRRTQFYRLAKTVGAANGDPDALARWAEGQPWLQHRGWLFLWAKLSIVISILAVVMVIAAALTGDLQSQWAKIGVYGLIVVPVINLLLSMTYLSPLHKVFAVAMTNRHSVNDYQTLVRLATELVSVSGNVDPVSATGDQATGDQTTGDQARTDDFAHSLLDTLSNPQSGANAGFASLGSISAAGSLRTSAATFLLYLPLQLFGLYDLWILRRLEDWQRRHRQHVRRWLEAVGSVEAIASVAAVRDEHPDWSNVTWTDPGATDTTLVSTQLGHPLLTAEQRVCNNVTIGPRGTLLLVTGSNMSGKSTMLRSVGLNVALAAAGGPVCAESMSLPPVEMATSIRVSDDLSQGVSFYMAELKRLKSVVDQAQTASTNDQRVCLFLLDEILQGTNSRERQIAVARVLDQLVQYGAIGAITTHDLELADDEQLMSKSRTVHFRETISQRDDGTDEMTFDYKMQQGVCPTTNAIRLLEIVGL